MITGIILAAGTSSRLGRPKQLLDLHGKPVLQHVIDAAAASEIDDVIVVLGHAAPAIEAALDLPENARTVTNEMYERGQATSLGAGVASIPEDCDAAVLLLGDQPQMTSKLIDSVIEEWRRTHAPVVRAIFGEVPGHPVLIASTEFHLVERALGDEGLRSVLGHAGDHVQELVLGDSPLADIDTEEQYERLRRG